MTYVGLLNEWKMAERLCKNEELKFMSAATFVMMNDTAAGMKISTPLPQKSRSNLKILDPRRMT
jgi:hypothetical protein